MSRIFLGNIPNASSEQEIGDWIQSFGFRVTSAEIVRDRITGNPRGFGFVELEDGTSTSDIIQQVHGQLLRGRRITVNEATPRTI